MNCSQPYKDTYPIVPGEIYSDAFYWDGACHAYNAVLKVLTRADKDVLNCTAKQRHTKGQTSNFTCHYDF